MANSKKSDGIKRKDESRPARPVSVERHTRHSAPSERITEETSAFLEHWEERGNEDDWNAATSESAASFPGKLDEDFGLEQRPLDPQFRQARVQTIHASAGRAPRSSGVRLKYWGAIGGVVVLATMFILLSTSLARLSVKVKPRTQDVKVTDINVVFDTGVAAVEPLQKTAPAEMLSFSKKAEQSFSATGKARVQDRARGAVKVINRFSAAPQTLVANTRFLTDGGVLFRLPKSIVVPGAKIEGGKIVAQSVETELVADTAGAQANMSGQIQLKIPGFQGTSKYEGFSAVASQGFSGGFEGEGSIITKEDLKNAQEQATKAVFDAVKADVASKIPQGFSSADGLQNIQIAKVEAPVVGTHADHFTVVASAVGKAVIFREGDAMALVQSSVLAGVTGQEFVDGFSHLQYRVRSVDFDKGRVDMTIAGTVKTRAVVHGDELVALIAGKKVGSIEDILRNRHELESINLSFFPPWRASAPGNPAKIHVIIEGQ